jgi:hypothetical protein
MDILYRGLILLYYLILAPFDSEDTHRLIPQMRMCDYFTLIATKNSSHNCIYKHFEDL